MSAPGSIELDEDVLLIVVDDLVKFIGNKYEDGLILGSGNRFALERGLKLASEVLVNELVGAVWRQRLGLRVWVLELLGHVLYDERRPFDLLEIHRLSVFTELDGVDPNKINFALELLGEGFVRFEESILGPVGRVKEEIGKWEAGLGVEAVVVTRDFVHQRSANSFEPVTEGLNGEGGEAACRIFDLGFIKLFVHNDCWGLDTSSRDDLRVRHLTEKVIITVLFGGLGEGGGRSIGASGVENGDDLVGGLETFIHILCN